ncbi:MAG: tRNA pseudouridine(38-40) synthase TruA, partial [Bacilli bacterium]|nr:tRNA pseudouridine(38-40) synthase TruA [Bacilli bacterium]
SRLDLNAMERGLKYLEGEHNFKSFTKTNEEIEDYVRKISQTSIVRDSKDINKIIITFVGTGFLRYMVRNMVGLLIEIGEGKKNPEDIMKILKEEDRKIAGKTAPACGLYLRNVFY